MRVMVTGGTGFVGAHSTKALLDAGHDVRLLVRDPARIDAALRPLGVEERPAFVVGDMLDAGAVREAVAGCSAVLHCAAIVALDRRRAAEVLESNPRGVRTVVEAALEAGVDPIVHVSSTSALFRPGLDRLHTDLPPAQVANAYGRSKATAETWVRERQAEGAPITMTYPAGVVGPPAGPAFGEWADGIVTHLRLGLSPVRDAAVSIIDVRDLGRVHAAVLVPGCGPRRYLCGGHFLTMGQLGELYRKLTGRRFPVVPLPGAVLRASGRVVDVAQRVLPFDSVITAEAMTVLTQWVPTDDTRLAELGVELRPVEETFADAIRGLHAAGRLTDRQVGRLADR
jgi:nucleoside-diphosphate-sugar epimerase